MAISDIAEAVAAGQTYIIAEIGQNHQGDMVIAKQLIDTAADAGVNAIKSQKRHTRTLLTPDQYDRPYDSPNAFADTYGAHRDALELSVEQHMELKAHAEGRGVAYFVSAWDPVSAVQMAEAGIPMFKIASASITDEETVRAMLAADVPMMMSTGMSTEEEIHVCAEWLRTSSQPKVMFHCTSTYPAKFEQLNLAYMATLQERYPDFILGVSGHHQGIAMDVAAVAMGAKVLERHFTLDRAMRGSDHAASLEVPGLQKLVRDVRAFEVALGDGIKRVYEEEVPMRAKLRRVQ